MGGLKQDRPLYPLSGMPSPKPLSSPEQSPRQSEQASRPVSQDIPRSPVSYPLQASPRPKPVRSPHQSPANDGSELYSTVLAQPAGPQTLAPVPVFPSLDSTLADASLSGELHGQNGLSYALAPINASCRDAPPQQGHTPRPSTEYSSAYPMQMSPRLKPMRDVSPPPTRQSESSETTAATSAPASPTTRSTRQAYPVQERPERLSMSRRTSSTTGMSNLASAFADQDGATKPAPKLPKYIHALKDGTGQPLPGRTIIVCLDGTGDKFDGDNTNIVHLVSCLKKSDPNQVSYYQSGIGTYDGAGLQKGFRAAMDLAIASGLGVHIKGAYHFLMQNYHEHDRICIFGFSRGAYTARCLAGMIHKVGLLPAHNIEQIDFAYQYYKDDSEEGWKMSGDFKRTFCMDVSVHFIGVFDSVASVGFVPRTLPLSSTPFNKAVYFRHAMSLDEHRAKFKVKQFEAKDSIQPDSHWESVAELHEHARPGVPAASFSPDLGAEDSAEDDDDDDTASQVDAAVSKLHMTRRQKLQHAQETDVLEVWFAGAHADVGGGAVANEERHKLAQIPLRWMIRQCFECNTGIIFNVHHLAQEGLDVHTLWPTYSSLGIPNLGPSPSWLEKRQTEAIPPITRRASVLKPVEKALFDVQIWKDEDNGILHQNWVPEQVEDYFDALSPINDQLVQARMWWILEYWPITMRVQHAGSDEWVKAVSINLGRYRAVQGRRPNLHWTVQQRMEAMGYKIQARLARNSAWNVVA